MKETWIALATPFFRRQGMGLAVFALFILLVSQTGQLAAQADTEQLDIIVIVDMSGSMCCTGLEPNDPEDRRINMAHLFVNFLGVDQSTNDYELGFVFFGTNAELIAQLTNVSTPGNIEQLNGIIDARVAAGENMGWTDARAALDTSLAALRAGRPGAKKAVVLLTDGEPRLREWEGNPELGEIYIDQLKEFVNNQWPEDIPVYTVAFTEEAYRESPGNQVYKNLWQEIAVTTGAPADRGYQEAITDEDLSEIYINILRSLVGLPPEELPPPEAVPVVKEFIIDQDLSQIIFVVIKDNPEITTTITQPNGQILRCPLSADVGSSVQCEGQGTREETISVRTPMRDRWTVALDGEGFIQFQAVPFPLAQRYSFEVIEPQGAHPAGKPMEITARVVDGSSGQAEPAERMGVVFEYPSGTRSEAIEMSLAADDNHTTTYADTTETGVYLLEFSADIAEGTVLGDGAVQVLPAPWIRIVQPSAASYPINLAVPVEVQLMFLNEPLTQPDPTWTFTASALLKDEADRIVGAIPLEPAAGGLFRGEMIPEREGAGIVEVSMLIETAGGERFADVDRQPFQVGTAVTLTPEPTATATATPQPTATPGPTATPSPTPVPPPPPEPPNPAVVGGGIGLLLLLLGGGVAGFYFWQLPSLSGDLAVDGAMSSDYTLRGKRAWIIGSDPKANIVLSGDNIAPQHLQLKPYSRGITLVNMAGSAPALGTADIDDDFGPDSFAAPASYAQPKIQSSDDASPQDMVTQHDLRDNDKIILGDYTLTYSNPALSGDALDDYLGDDDDLIGSGSFSFDDDPF